MIFLKNTLSDYIMLVGDCKMKLDENNYITRLSGREYRDWFLIKPHRGVAQLQLNRIMLPVEMLGKKVKVKLVIEEIGDDYERNKI